MTLKTTILAGTVLALAQTSLTVPAPYHQTETSHNADIAARDLLDDIKEHASDAYDEVKSIIANPTVAKADLAKAEQTAEAVVAHIESELDLNPTASSELEAAKSTAEAVVSRIESEIEAKATGILGGGLLGGLGDKIGEEASKVEDEVKAHITPAP